MGNNRNFIIGAVVLAAVVFLGVFFFSKRANTPETSVAPAPVATASVDPSLLIRPHSLIIGPADAKITVVEFLDPQCEACAAMHPVVKRLLKEYEGRMRLVIRYMPFHPHALYAASVLEEARESGKFDRAWEIMAERLHDWGGHHDAKPELLAEYMKEIGIDKMRAEEAYVVKKHGDKVKQDEADGRQLGVDRTPTFFINGVMLSEIGYEPLKSAFDSRLAN